MTRMIEQWEAVYRRVGKEFDLIALFRHPEDANQFDENPAVYFHASRRVKVSPHPIEPVGIQAEALVLLDAIVNGPDDKMPIDAAKEFLSRLKAEEKPKERP